MKSIGIIGSGSVAKILGNGFLKHGYQVMLGTRNPEKLTEWQSQNRNAQIGNFSEAAKFGEIIVLAVKGAYAKDALRLANAKNLAGKIILDATNPIDETKGVQNGALTFFTKNHQSLMGILQKAFPNARFVKAFNSVGGAFMVNPQFPNGTLPTMFICGNDSEAKKETAKILHQFGWDSEDVGGVESANAVEQLCILWCAPGFLRNQWGHAFHLLKS